MNFLCCSVFLCSKNFYGKLFDQEAAADPFIDFCCKIKLSSFSRTGRLMDSSRVMIRYIEHPACKILTASSRPISLIRDMSSPKGTKRAKLKPQIKSNFIFFFFCNFYFSWNYQLLKMRFVPIRPERERFDYNFSLWNHDYFRQVWAPCRTFLIGLQVGTNPYPSDRQDLKVGIAFVGLR